MSFLIWLIVVYAFYRLYHLATGTLKPTQFGFKGKLVYSDQGRSSKLFINKRFGLSAKPDFIYNLLNGMFALVEYKSRNGRIFQSDIEQTIAGVIACRPHYNIRVAVIQTASERKEINVDKSVEELYEMIKHNVELTRKIKNGLKVDTCYPTKYKCKSCAVANNCQFK